MFRLKVKVMIVCIGSKADLFHLRGLALGLHFLRFLLLIVKEFIVIDDLANGGIRTGRNFNEVQLLGLGHFQRFLGRIHANFNILSHQSYLGNAYEMIDAMFWFFARNESSSETTATGAVKRSVL